MADTEADECGAESQLLDVTFVCQLKPDHEGKHREEIRMLIQDTDCSRKIVIEWEGDDRKREPDRVTETDP